MIDVTSIGELLIDFVCPEAEVSLEAATQFVKKAGGAPANVAAAVARLGGAARFVGKVGDDAFGRYLRQTLADAKVDVGDTLLDAAHKTSLAFVSLKKNGERDFEFFREPGADVMLHAQELDIPRILSTRILHFGSISLIGGPIRDTLLSLLPKAKQAGCWISYDPNLRPALWPSIEAAREGMREGLAYANSLKVSEEELHFMTGCSNESEALAALHAQGIALIFVTRGPNGATASTVNDRIHCAGQTVDSIDTTGAGDAFVGASLTRIAHQLARQQDPLAPENLRETLQVANAAGAITTTQYGAIAAMPDEAALAKYA